MVLLHGFPQFWWAWRGQMSALAAAGYRVAAMDLRGYGASDKPPRGYDTFTLAADVASVIRSLGEKDATVVGHGWGGWIAWSMPTMQPAVTRAVGALSMPHPLVLRRASVTNPAQIRANAYLAGLQRPFVPERQMTRGPGYVDAPAARLGRARGRLAVPRGRRALRRRDGAALRGPLRGGVLPVGRPQPAAARRPALRPAPARRGARAGPLPPGRPRRRGRPLQHPRLGGLRHRPLRGARASPAPGTSCPRRPRTRSTPTSSAGSTASADRRAVAGSQPAAHPPVPTGAVAARAASRTGAASPRVSA